jgi:DNA-binding transcriptional MerR regulator
MICVVHSSQVTHTEALMTAQFLSTGDVGRWLGVAPPTVRQLVQSGQLHVAAATFGGINLFRPDDVLALAERRAQHRAVRYPPILRTRQEATRRPKAAPERGSRRVQQARHAETRRRVLQAIAAARQGVPLKRAARAAHTTVATIRKYAPTVVQRDIRRRLVVVPYDRMKRPMRVLTPHGVLVLDVRHSRSASRLGQYWNAVDAALRGDLGPLRAFRGKSIRVGKVAYPYLTDMRTLKRLAHAGEVRFEDLYDTTR